MDPASRKMVQFSLLGLVIAGAMIVGLQLRPASILPVNGTVNIQLAATDPIVSGGGSSCRIDCNFTSLMVTVDSIKVHRTGALNFTAEWIVVVSSTKTIDLLQVKNIPQLLGSASVPEGMITQIRMNVTEATGTLASGKTVSLIVPSGELKLNLQPLTVTEGTTTSVTIEVEPHIVHTGNDQWKLTPVLHTRSN